MAHRSTSTFRVLALAASLGAAVPTGVAAQQISYRAPGDILPKTTSGIADRRVEFADWGFPMKVGPATGQHAYMGTQLSQYHGLPSANDPRLYSYPHRDNQCEPRSWKVTRCPSGRGHQGLDIRPNTNEKNKWEVVSVEDGVVTSVTNNTTVRVKSGNHTVRYLHMSPASIAAAGIRPGVKVGKGQVLGKVSCIMNGTCSTSVHLHIDAYSGTAGSGDFHAIYADFVAAYLRAWGVANPVENGLLKVDPVREVSAVTSGPAPTGGVVAPGDAAGPAEPDCAQVALAATPGTVDPSQYASLWRHNCSVVGLAADTASGARRFAYLKPKATIAETVAAEPVLFEGVNEAGRYSGMARSYSSRCGTQMFAVTGQTSSVGGRDVVELTGRRPQRNQLCDVIGEKQERLVFTFMERAAPVEHPAPHVPPVSREQLSEKTRNFLALTFGKGVALPAFIAEFPGLVPGVFEEDKDGNVIPALTTDEAGVALSWTWINRRARFTNGLVLTPRQVAHSMAGVEPSACDADIRPTAAAIAANGAAADGLCLKVLNYLRGYIGFANGRGFATEYFGRAIGIDESLNLALTDVAWNWMRAMYSHESGRSPVIDRATFERGVALGEDWIAMHYDGDRTRLRPMAFYSDPCNFRQADCGRPTGPVVRPTEPTAPEGGDVAAELAAIAADLADAQARLAALSGRLVARGGGSDGGL